MALRILVRNDKGRTTSLLRFRDMSATPNILCARFRIGISSIGFRCRLPALAKFFRIGEDIYPSNSKPVSISGSSSFVSATSGNTSSNNLSIGCTTRLRRLEIGVGGDCLGIPLRFGAECIRLTNDGFSGEGVGSSGMSVKLAAEEDRQRALIESSLGEWMSELPATS
jgi:hypothetical protein